MIAGKCLVQAMLVIQYLRFSSGALRGINDTLFEQGEARLDNIWHKVNSAMRVLIDADSRSDSKLDALTNAYHAYYGWVQSMLNNEGPPMDYDYTRIFDKMFYLHSCLETALGDTEFLETEHMAKVREANEVAKQVDSELAELPDTLYDASDGAGIIEQLESLMQRVNLSRAKIIRISGTLGDLRRNSYGLLDSQSASLDKARIRALESICTKIDEKLQWLEHRQNNYSSNYEIAKKTFEEILGVFRELEKARKVPTHEKGSEGRFVKPIGEGYKTLFLSMKHIQHELSYKFDPIIMKIHDSLKYVKNSLKLLQNSSEITAQSNALQEHSEKIQNSLEAFQKFSNSMNVKYRKLVTKLQDLIKVANISLDESESADTSENVSPYAATSLTQASGTVRLSTYLHQQNKPVSELKKSSRSYTVDSFDVNILSINHQKTRRWKSLYLIMWRLLVSASLFVAIMLCLLVYLKIRRRQTASIFHHQPSKHLKEKNLKPDPTSFTVHPKDVSWTKKRQSSVSTWAPSNTSIEFSTP